jgi:hydroxymethylpyrimidine kinase / phosphomethylpyrimidine kinase / thiamine-phosphate diphosphorylase
VCIVRGLGEDPRTVVPLLQAALDAGRREFAQQGAPRHWPHPSLVEAE